MENESNNLIIQKELTIEEIKNLIYTIRGKQVMLDNDVAHLYHCETKYVNRVVKRNINRFPQEFCFQLNENEYNTLRCKIFTLNENGRGQHRKFENVIKKVKESCENSDISTFEHFVDIDKMIKMPKGATKNIKDDKKTN